MLLGRATLIFLLDLVSRKMTDRWLWKLKLSKIIGRTGLVARACPGPLLACLCHKSVGFACMRHRFAPHSWPDTNHLNDKRCLLQLTLVIRKDNFTLGTKPPIPCNPKHTQEGRGAASVQTARTGPHNLPGTLLSSANPLSSPLNPQPSRYEGSASPGPLSEQTILFAEPR